MFTRELETGKGGGGWRTLRNSLTNQLSNHAVRLPIWEENRDMRCAYKSVHQTRYIHNLLYVMAWWSVEQDSDPGSGVGQKWRPQQAYGSNQVLLAQPQTIFSTHKILTLTHR